MAAHVDYYLTPVSPWAFLGHDRFAALLAETGATVSVRPVDFGAVFAVSGGLPLPKRAPQRQAYRLRELQRFADHLGIALHVQPAFFPVAADAASRLIVATERAQGSTVALDLAGRIGRAIWCEQRNVADASVLEALLKEAGLSGQLLTDSAAPALADTLAGYTQQAIDVGVFGAPSYVIDGEIFWGQDRLDFVARRLRQAPQPA
jgi:2-hydroxychromene-2-carboxylate isomerase